uniref:ZAD domain-containing protein n=1 Tax=Anopheles minimus TaxID=112268 RepID=A0A182WAL3_9DIPT
MNFAATVVGEEIQQKYVCGICWTYVDDFNNFYEQIKMIHDAEEQEVMALEDDSIQCEENDINETEISLEEESFLLLSGVSSNIVKKIMDPD